jgi:hypothetical protein
MKIPKTHQLGLIKLSALDDRSIHELFTALETVTPTLLAKSLARKVWERARAIPKDDVEGIIQAAIGMHRSRSAAVTPSQFAENICKALEDSSKSFKLSPEDRETFKQRLVRLLGFDSSLGTTAKALNVLLDHERVLCSARVITDIRSIFSIPSEKPTAAVIVHMLKISYHQDMEHKDFFVALDSSDIGKLKEVLERAEQKAKSLVTVLQASGVSALEPHEYEDSI